MRLPRNNAGSKGNQTKQRRGNVMNGLQNKKNNLELNVRPGIKALADEELADAAGGNFPGLYPERTDFYLWANLTTQVGSGDKQFKKVINYYPCPRCGKPMHSKWYSCMWYCDPCNFSSLRPAEVRWNGTKEELIAAAGF